MRSRALLTMALLCALAGAGCIPRTLETSPAVQGRVVDEATAAPVAGANVTIMPVELGSKKPTDSPVTTVTAGLDGRFNAPALFDRFWVPAPR